jgi:hypothetical protein
MANKMSNKTSNLPTNKVDNKSFTVEQILEMKNIIEERKSQAGENNNSIDYSLYFFKPNTEKVPANKDPNRRTYYMDVMAQHPSGNYIPFVLKLGKQVIAANAKPPTKPSKPGEQSAKHIKLTFMSLTRDDLEKTKIIPGKIDQALEDNKKLIEALEFVSQELKRAINDIVIACAGSTYTLAKNQDINSFVQYKRKIVAGEKGDRAGKIDLDTPIYRIRINADPITELLGQKPCSFRNSHKYIIFDQKKLNKVYKDCKKKNITPPKSFIVAQLNTTEGPKDLTLQNAHHFITRFSTVTGKIKLENICISNFGISETLSVEELHVESHPFVPNQSYTIDELVEMGEYGEDNSDDDVPIDLSAAVESSKKKKAVSRKIERDDDDEDDDDNQIDEPEEDDEDSPKPAAKPAAKPSKLAKPVAKPAAKPVAKPVAKPAAKPAKPAKPVVKKSKKVEELEDELEESGDEQEELEDASADSGDEQEETFEEEPEGKKTKNNSVNLKSSKTTKPKK